MIEEVGGAAGEQPDRVVQHLLIGGAEQRTQPVQIGQILGCLAEEVRRDPVEERLEQLADPLDVVLVAVHRVRVVGGVPGDLLDVLVTVRPEQQVVAVLHRGERGRHQDRQETVFDQVEFLDDVRAQQAQRVRERGEVKAGYQFLGDRCAADERAALDDQRPQPGLGQIGAVDQAVVATADDDRVVRPARARLWAHLVLTPSSARD
jgi:hypothetical protein